MIGDPPMWAVVFLLAVLVGGVIAVAATIILPIWRRDRSKSD
jgi:hypothetical protein